LRLRRIVPGLSPGGVQQARHESRLCFVCSSESSVP
jgi:hypothetical protein